MVKPDSNTTDPKGSHVTVIRLNSTSEETSSAIPLPNSEPKIAAATDVCTNSNNSVLMTSISNVSSQIQQGKKPLIPLLPKPPGKDNKSTKIRQHNPILQPTPVSTNASSGVTNNPPVESIGKNKDLRNANLRVAENTSDALKSKSLPRGMPSDFDSMDSLPSMNASKVIPPPAYLDDMISGDGMPSLNPFPAPKPHLPTNPKSTREDMEEERRIDELQLELLRVKFENEELEAYKKELEWRKRSERKEMEELREEMATMQTLYQYRTYSVDSSENSSDEGSDKENVKEEAEELAKVLADLKRENRELEEKRAELCQKIQDERSACIQLRVQIKVEQERMERKRRGVSFAP